MGHVLVLTVSAAEEGRKIIIAMLLVGLVFASIVVLGEFTHYYRHFRHRR